MPIDHQRRFGGITRLYGEEGAQRIFAAHVAVIGIGGVGSWAAEALARSGIGELTLVDLDMVAESNTNRQLHALDNLYGKAKVTAMAERIELINPRCIVHCIEDFVTVDNLAQILGGTMHVTVDAIDQTRIKAAMIAWCQRNGRRIVVAGAAGGQFDPTLVRVDDLSQTTQDPLLAKVRALLRREYGFSREGKKKFAVPAVYSTEALRYPAPNTSCSTEPTGPLGLNCAGFGSSVCVTSVFGMAAAAQALKVIVSG